MHSDREKLVEQLQDAIDYLSMAAGHDDEIAAIAAAIAALSEPVKDEPVVQWRVGEWGDGSTKPGEAVIFCDAHEAAVAAGVPSHLAKMIVEAHNDTLASPAPVPAARLYTEAELAEHVAIAVQQGMQRAARTPVPAEAVAAPVLTVDEIEEIIKRTETATTSDGGVAIWTRRMASALSAALNARLSVTSDMPVGDGSKLPRLTERMMRAACKAHFGDDNIDGINLTADGVDWSFRDAFKRMWKGLLAASAEEAGR